MTPTLELYLEKILTQMNLDDVQRREVECEFRDHLEALLEQARKKAGLGEREAEAQAMRVFGEPSLVARQFGLGAGMGWFVFERLALALLIPGYLIFLFPYGSLAGKLATGLFALAFILYQSFRERIEVNGVLRVRRLLLPAQSVSFDQIKTVDLAKGHLFGNARHLRLETKDGRTLRFRTNMRGARCAGMALLALAPEAVAPRVREYFESKLCRLRTEGSAGRIALSVGWAAVAGLTAAGIEVTWNLEGISAWMLIAWAVALAVGGSQCWWHVHRTRRGLTSLGMLAIIVGMSIFYALYAGDPLWARGYLIVFGAGVLTGLLMLWWRGSRGSMMSMSAAVFAIAAGTAVAVSRPAENTAWTLGVSPIFVEEGRFVESDATTYVGRGIDFTRPAQDEYDQNSLIIVQGDRIEQTPLPSGMWYVAIGGTGEPLSFLRMITENYQYRGMEVYLVSPEGVVEHFERISTKEAAYSLLGERRLLWSPDGNWCVLPGAADEATGRPRLRLVNRRTGSEEAFEIAYSTLGWWRDEETLELWAPVDPADEGPIGERLAPDAQPPKRYQQVRIRPSESEVEWLKVRELDAGYQAMSAITPELVGLGIRDKSYEPTEFRWIDAIWDLRTGEIEALPEGSQLLDLNRETGQFALWLRGGEGSTVQIRSGRGIIHEHSLAADEQLRHFLLSPDGKRYFQSRSGKTHLPYLDHGLLHFQMGSVGVGGERTVWRPNLIRSMMIEITSLAKNAAVDWSPDGRGVLVPIPEPNRETRNTGARFVWLEAD